MRCFLINGTSVRGCSYNIKEIFLDELKADELVEIYLPKDGPDFCLGCKLCFNEGEDKFPHYDKMGYIWDEMKKADLIVFVYPVYVMRAPGQVKTLLDHLGVHWFAHRPEKMFFDKKAAIITQSIGAPNGPAQKDVKTSLEWMGISDIHTLGHGLNEGVIWNELSEKKRTSIEKKTRMFARKVRDSNRTGMKLKVKFYNLITRAMQRGQRKKLKQGQKPSLDLQHWIDNELI